MVLTDLAEWNTPDGGMFLWIKVHGVRDTTKMIEDYAISKNVALLPGSVFEVISATPSAYVRASYSMATPENIDLVSHALMQFIVLPLITSVYFIQITLLIVKCAISLY